MSEHLYEFEERLNELLKQLSPTDDYQTAVDYFSHFTRDVPRLIERRLDGFGDGFDYMACRFPDHSQTPRQKGVLIVTDVTFGDPDSEAYWEVLMSFSEFLRWLRAIARLWGEIHPCDSTALQHMFHIRELAYLESEVGGQFDNGATWWRKIEQQRVTVRTICQNYVSSPQWKYANDYFRDISDVAFPTWLSTWNEGGELPRHWLQAKRLPDGGLKLFRAPWGNNPEQYVEIPRGELENLLSELVEALAERRPRHTEEARSLLSQIKSRP